MTWTVQVLEFRRCTTCHRLRLCGFDWAVLPTDSPLHAWAGKTVGFEPICAGTAEDHHYPMTMEKAGSL